MKTLASIDIGTNTILMTIATGDSPSNFKILEDIHSIARLGEGVSKTKIISQDAVKRAELILKDYRLILDKHKVERVLAVCTSAMRDARNGLEIIHLFEKILNGKVIIIEGEKEANLSFYGTIEDPLESAVIDIGGGSTEIILGNNNEVNYRISTILGAVRLSEQFFQSLPPNKYEAEVLKNYIQAELSNIPLGDFNGKVYAVAGTATTLASMDLNLKEFDKDLIHNHVLKLNRIEDLSRELLSSRTEDIVLKYNIPQRRADVLPAGALILMEIVKSMNKTEIFASTFGLRYGVLKRMFESTM